MVLRLWAVVAAFAALTVARSAQVAIGLRDPHGAILLSRVALSAGIFVVLVVIDGAWRTTSRRTLGSVSRTVRERWTCLLYTSPSPRDS